MTFVFHYGLTELISLEQNTLVRSLNCFHMWSHVISISGKHDGSILSLIHSVSMTTTNSAHLDATRCDRKLRSKSGRWALRSFNQKDKKSTKTPVERQHCPSSSRGQHHSAASHVVKLEELRPLRDTFMVLSLCLWCHIVAKAHIHDNFYKIRQ